MKRSTERWRNDTDRGKQLYLAKNVSQYHIFHHKTSRNVPGVEHGPPRGEAGYIIPEP